MRTRWIRKARWAGLAIAAPERALVARGIGGPVPFPDFLGIGAAKAGSTWLYRNLRAHPEVFMPTPKELYYFDLNWWRRIDHYAAYFADAGDRVAGEITPAYALLPRRRIAWIDRMNPELRVLFSIRHPVDRAWSYARMKLARRVGRPVSAVGDDEYLAHFRSDASRARGAYSTTIERWREVVGDRLLVTCYDDIATRPVELLSEVFGHVGVTADGLDWDTLPWASTALPGVEGEIPDHLRAVLHELYAEEIEQVGRLVGGPARAWT